jgi:hypothetical protein
MGKTLKKLCTKVFNPIDIQNLRTYVVETLCMLEIWWPLGSFDLQNHLIIHLVDELNICGLMGSKWCYPIEQYLHVLRKYVRKKTKLKGCMASGYMYDEALGFTTEYLALYLHSTHHIWDANEEEVDVG